MKQRDFAGAIDLLRRSVALNSKSFEAQFNLGLAYNNTGRFQQAAEMFETAIEMAPGHPDVFQARFQLGIAYAELNLTAKAAREFEATLELKPDFTPAREALAMAESQMKQPAANPSPAPPGPPKSLR